MHHLNDRSPFGERKIGEFGIQDEDPVRVRFPLNTQFSCPAKYHTDGQTFNVGDVVWYELKGSFKNSRDFIQWGEAVVKEVNLEKNTYRLAGKAWNYDHYTHPLLGTGVGGLSQFINMTSAEDSRIIYRSWAQTYHPNSHVRRNALIGVDEVMHPQLMSVPGEAMFKVWDRDTIPKNPIRFNYDEEEEEGENVSSLNISPVEKSLEAAREEYGPELQFEGTKQNELGPEMWGITIEQLIAVKDLDGYNESMLMYEVVEKLIKPQTKGKGIGYSLLLNSENPLRAKLMVSHAWGERYDHFVRAIKDSNAKGPFWVCAMAIYQNEDIPSVTISKQLGPSIENGPFATVLKQADGMIAVFTPSVDIYLRMWCVFEIFIAVKLQVPVRFAALSYQFRSGMENMYDAIFEHGRNKTSSNDARCGNPKLKMNSDEKQIRQLINAYPGKFHTIDAVIEWCKAVYHISEVAHPGAGFRSDPDHYLFLGGPGRFDYLAKNLSSIALALDRLDAAIDDIEKTKAENPMCCDCRIA